MNFLKFIAWSSKCVAFTLGGTLFLSACSFSNDALWPSLAGEGGQTQTAQQPTSTTAPVASPALGTSTFVPEGVTEGQPTGTFVGDKVIELRDELKRLQSSIAVHNETLQGLRANIIQGSQRYHNNVAQISTRLQIGTTPGNPNLIQQFNQAQADLDLVATDVNNMNGLATAVTGDATMSNFLADAARSAFTVSGAVDEDHRQLAILEDEINKTSVLIDRLLTETTIDVRRQTSYVANERSNLNVLAAGIKTGEIYGANLMNRAMLARAGPALGAAPITAMDTSGRRPLIVIRFDRDDIAYQQTLYTAVSRVLEQRPGATFDLVSVAPQAGGEANIALNTAKARRLADGVLRSLVEMGLPTSRVAVSSKTSAAARNNEVHLYLR